MGHKHNILFNICCWKTWSSTTFYHICGKNEICSTDIGLCIYKMICIDIINIINRFLASLCLCMSVRDSGFHPVYSHVYLLQFSFRPNWNNNNKKISLPKLCNLSYKCLWKTWHEEATGFFFPRGMCVINTTERKVITQRNYSSKVREKLTIMYTQDQTAVVWTGLANIDLSRERKQAFVAEC